jgi:AcrR family transcriptional regulator
MGRDAKPVDRGERLRKRRGAGHERRGEILAAARLLFCRSGYEAVTTRMLAEAAGLSQTGLYVYFKGKEEILEALRHETFERLAALIAETAEASPPGPALLRRLFSGYVAFALANPDDYQLAFAVSHVSLKAAGRRSLETAPADEAPRMHAFLAFRGQLERSLPPARATEATEITEVAWAALHGLATLLITMPDFPWSAREKLIDRTVGMLLADLRS